MIQTRTEYDVLEDRKFPGDWRVEAIGSDGEVYVAIFSGSDARTRATDYAAWKNSRN